MYRWATTRKSTFTTVRFKPTLTPPGWTLAVAHGTCNGALLDSCCVDFGNYLSLQHQAELSCPAATAKITSFYLSDFCCFVRFFFYKPPPTKINNLTASRVLWSVLKERVSSRSWLQNHNAQILSCGCKKHKSAATQSSLLALIFEGGFSSVLNCNIF